MILDIQFVMRMMEALFWPEQQEMLKQVMKTSILSRLIKMDIRYGMLIYGWPHTDVIRSVIPLSDGYLFAGEIWDYGLYDSDIYLAEN